VFMLVYHGYLLMENVRTLGQHVPSRIPAHVKGGRCATC
jgi:hypothetical protein